MTPARDPYLIVLGIAQDGGVPQPGAGPHPGGDGFVRRPACLAIVDPRCGGRWLIDCTPHFPEQLLALDRVAPRGDAVLDGIFLTHAHVGHYAGLIHLGHEVMGARGIPLHAMPRMAGYLSGNGPWNQLIRHGNVSLLELSHGVAVELSDGLSVEPLLVPHRQEYSETVGFCVRGSGRRALFIPDIDGWSEWDDLGAGIEDWLERVDVAYLDGTFYADGEIPGRDMSGFRHPFITHSMERFASLDAATRAKVRFIHLNHTNPALIPGSAAALRVEAEGFGLAREGERFNLTEGSP